MALVFELELPAFDYLAPTRAARRASSRTRSGCSHFCLGANLARAELQEALAFLAPCMSGLALDGEPEFDSITGIYGLRALPIRYDGSAQR